MRTKWNLSSVNWSPAWIRWNLICAQTDQQSKSSFIVGERWWRWTGVKWTFRLKFVHLNEQRTIDWLLMVFFSFSGYLLLVRWSAKPFIRHIPDEHVHVRNQARDQKSYHDTRSSDCCRTILSQTETSRVRDWRCRIEWSFTVVQVMIVCQAGDVSFWSLEGQKTKRFNDQDASESIDTTCLGFDELGEKFYTGGSDGKVRVSLALNSDKWPSVSVDLELQWSNSTSAGCGKRFGGGNHTNRGIETACCRSGMEQVRIMNNEFLSFEENNHSRQLTVFRDIQEVEGRPSLPTEWKDEKSKREVKIRLHSSIRISLLWM